MQITRATDYAVRVMIHLASLSPGSTVRQSELSRATDVSGHFLSKVLQQLVRCRFIRSQRGSGGGYALAVSAGSVSLLDVVEAMEGPVHLNQCLEKGPSCDRKAWCPAHQVWIEAQAAVRNVLGKASVANLAAQAQAGAVALYRMHEQPIWVTGVSEKGHGKASRRTHGH